MDSLDKKFYRINEVSEMLGVPYSTLRFWETCFKKLKPRRNAGGTRLYSPDDLELLHTIVYLVKVRGLKIEAAQDMLKVNPAGVSRKANALARLTQVRNRLEDIIKSLPRR